MHEPLLEPPMLVTALLIVWVRLSSDAGTFWRPQGVTIPFFSSDSAMCVHEHFEANFYNIKIMVLRGGIEPLLTRVKGECPNR